MIKHSPAHGIHTIDAHYIAPHRASVYLIVENGRAAFVDTNTVFAVPRMLDVLQAAGLSPGDVDYVLVTHVHLDHAGGAAELLRQCPNATALVHPKTARHLAKPDRLIQAARLIYHDRFDSLYGVIEPVPAPRMRIVSDGETIDWGTRRLTFLHTLGHATHHYCVHDNASRSVFAGDSFGIAYPALQGGARPYIFAAATPTEFDPAQAREAALRILALEPARVYLGHFGGFDATAELCDQLLRTIDGCGAVVDEAARCGLEGDALRLYVQDRVERLTLDELGYCGLPTGDATRMWVDPDIMLNTQGVVAAAVRRRREMRGAVE